MFRMCLVTFSLMLLSKVVLAQEPKVEPKAEWVPAPKVLPPKTIYVMPLPARPNPYSRELYQYYGFDNTGRLRPRVILAPNDGSYYYYNGRPYPYTSTRDTINLPLVVN